MPLMVKVWDRKAEGGPAQLDMYSLNAKEALRRDPDRYSLTDPNLKPPEAVDRTEAPRPAVGIDIPADWESQPYQDRRKLAIQLGAEKNCSSEIANAIIAASVKRRDPEPAPEPEPVVEPVAGED